MPSFRHFLLKGQNPSHGQSVLVSSRESAAISIDAQYPLVTHIWVSIKLRRIPVELYVVVKSEVGTYHTPKKPTEVGKDVVEWDVEIALPLETPSKVSFSAVALFELGSSEEVVHEFDVTVGELLDHSSRSEFIGLFESRDGNVKIRLKTSISPSQHVSDANHPVSRGTRRTKKLVDIGLRVLVRCNPSRSIRDVLDFLFRDAFVWVPNPKIAMLEVFVRHASDTHPDKPIWLENLARLLWDRYERFRKREDLEKSISLQEDALRLMPGDDPDRQATLTTLAIFLSKRFVDFQDPVDLEKAILLQEDALRLTPDDHPDKQVILTNLAISLSRRFERFGASADLQRSILLREDALRLMPDDHPSKHSRLANLATSLSSRFEHSRDLADLEKSISLREDALRLTPDDHPSKQERFADLAISLSSRFERFGDLSDLEKSILLQEDTLQLTPDDHPDKHARLAVLADSLSSRFERFGDPADLERSISLQEDALQLTPGDHPDKRVALLNLAISLSSRFARFHDLADLDKSILLREDALQLMPDDHPDKQARLTNLAMLLSGRFVRFGDLVDLQKLILLLEDALRLTPDDHPDKHAILGDLATSLSSRFKRFGNLTDLEKSISLQEDALRLTPDDHPDKHTRLSNFAMSLSSRFERFGDPGDLEKSISLQEDALHLILHDHPSKHARLADLASSLSSRFERFGDLADLQKSISLLEDALQLTPYDHPSKHARLADLADSLLNRFERFGGPADLERSISLREDALRLMPGDHPSKQGILANLAISLSRRFKHFGDFADLQKSILLQEDALQLMPDDHPSKQAISANLAISLSSCFERFGDLAALEKSMSLQEQALLLTPDGHPIKLLHLMATARLYLQSYRVRRLGDSSTSDLRQAIEYSSRAAHSCIGKPSIRFKSCRVWIQCLRLLPLETAPLFDAYTVAINLLPQLAWLGLSFQDRYHFLLGAAGIVSDAAASVLDLHMPELAIEWLEQGRSIMWSQVSRLRTLDNDLRSAHPALAALFENVSRELEHAGVRCTDGAHTLISHSEMTSKSLKQQAVQYHTLALQHESLLVEIRALPGFERFLLPKKIDQLFRWTYTGHFILLNASRYRCDALVVIGGSKQVIHVPLSQINYKEVVGIQGQLSKLLLDKRLRDERDIHRAARLVRLGADDVFRSILSDLWHKVVSPILDVLGLTATPPANLPRIIWCPTGPFTFLPIHAVGIYDTDNCGPKLSDFVISSYVPTLGALQERNQPVPQTVLDKIRFLAVPQPSTDGQRHLPCVKEEMEIMRALTSSSPSIDFREADGTVEDVLAKIQQSDWVHFCCHGTQDHANPLDSGLLLADGRRLKLSDIVQLSRPRGGLAFLSACQTAMGDEQLSDEAIHLAAGMLLAGYDGVIATMWSIMDNDAPKVTRDVYETLFGDGKVPDTKRAAEALHHAIEQLRDSGASFLSWVPFVHYGL